MCIRDSTEVGLRALRARDGDQAEQLAVHDPLPSQVGVTAHHRNQSREVDAHVEDAGDVQRAVVLPDLGGHPGSLPLEPEPASDVRHERPVTRPVQHTHRTQIAPHRGGQLSELILGYRLGIVASHSQSRLTNLVGQPPVHLVAMPEHAHSLCRGAASSSATGMATLSWSSARYGRKTTRSQSQNPESCWTRPNIAASRRTSWSKNTS